MKITENVRKYADYFLTCDDRVIRRYIGTLTVQTPPNFISNQSQP